MIPLYCRLSVADGDQGESGSITNQRAILMDFVAARDDLRGEPHRFYVDDGISGTHAENRPALQEMLADCRAGKVSTVVAKDLSRLSRDGLYCVGLVEDELPAMGVRVIAVSDNYDSRRERARPGAGTELGFKAIMNSWYSKDLSRKVTQSIRAEHARGMNLNTVPFGYRKGGDRHSCEVDEVSGPIVARAFQLAASGMSQAEVAAQLNEEGAVTPHNLRAMRSPAGRLKPKEGQRWTGAMVKGVLTNSHHKGTLVLGKSRRVEMGLAAKRATDDGERTVLEGAHPAIVAPETWARAQASITSSNAGGAMEPLNHLFSGLVFCPHCGKAASFRSKTASYTAYCGCFPSAPSVRLDDLERTVAAVARRHADLVVGLSEAMAAKDAGPDGPAGIERRLGKIAAEKIGAYERYRAGDADAAGFGRAVARLREEELLLRRRLSDLRDGRAEPDPLRIERALELAKRLGEGPLDREAVEALVDRIELLGDGAVEVTLAYRDLFADL